MPSVATPEVTWKAAGANSAIVQLQGQTVCGFYIPASFVGTTLKVNATYDASVPPVAVIDSTGADVSYTVAAGKFLRVNPGDFAGIAAFQLVSNGTEVANTVVKTAVREIA